MSGDNDDVAEACGGHGDEASPADAAPVAVDNSPVPPLHPPPANVSANDSPPSQTLIEQDFACLEEALDAGVWEVDGDDLSLYVCEEGDASGPAGAVLATDGHCHESAELVHWLSGQGGAGDGAGARVASLTAHIVIEELDAETAGTFTVGLAYDDDFEEAAILALTLRRARRDPGHEGGRDDLSVPVSLLLNGSEVCTDIGELPARMEFEATLRWDEGARRVELRYCVSPSSGGGVPIAADTAAAAATPDVTEGFYTPGTYNTAKALCLRGNGTMRVRLLYIRCLGP